jgi:hypothetical protein
MRLYTILGDWVRRRMLQREIKELLDDYRDSKARQEEAYQRGFLHGSNKAVPVHRRLARAEFELAMLRQRYRAEIGQSRAYLERVRQLDPEIFRRVMQEKHPPKPSSRPCNRGVKP